jgi:hypothetical protein
MKNCSPISANRCRFRQRRHTWEILFSVRLVPHHLPPATVPHTH